VPGGASPDWRGRPAPDGSREGGLGDGAGTRFEYGCYDVGHLYNLAHMVDRGLAKPPFLIQCIFGILGGIGADPDNLQHMLRVGLPSARLAKK
jgi:uncharacterized protein (DUF849 family)